MTTLLIRKMVELALTMPLCSKYLATGCQMRWKSKKRSEMCASKILKMKTKSW